VRGVLEGERLAKGWSCGDDQLDDAERERRLEQ